MLQSMGSKSVGHDSVAELNTLLMENQQREANQKLLLAVSLYGSLKPFILLFCDIVVGL